MRSKREKSSYGKNVKKAVVCSTIFIAGGLLAGVMKASAEDVGSQVIYRVYNPKSGEHFYTANEFERDNLVNKNNWKYEGIGWVAPVSSKIPVYRLYSKNIGDHHYTASVAEKNNLVKSGWEYEGISWYGSESNKVPVYRAYNKNAKSGRHSYTTSEVEQQNLIKNKWQDEGVAWSAIGTGVVTNTAGADATTVIKQISSNPKFADPSAISVKGVTYMYGTGTGGKKIPLAIMNGDGSYRVVKDALNRLPKWGTGGIWAPSVSKFNGKYYLYFSVKDKTTGKRRIAVATSSTPDGTFSVSDNPVIAMDNAGGVIDPSIYIENGTPYLLYKNDGNAIMQASNLYIRKLTASGFTAASNPYKMISNLNVENPSPKHKGKPASTIEAPSLIKSPDGTYVLFFAGNSYATTDYFTGYATSKSLLGTYKYQNTVLTTEKTNNKIQGSGGAEILTSDSGEKKLYLHGWVNYNSSTDKKRVTYGIPFSWQGGHVPYVNVK
ncbi:family 43 glycosylhydrolase [Lactococcus insecticola]|uniref:DUF5648 domain-containing protein n=1 Tax=Pseudolactococcus insecticola TaxID=2709158 RepID=A0A6A0B5X5_9LACT|nr:family 43 glycosylhydrolase [Lactococcus insecticola]GFH40800.1 hypothetical protein Hs20B_11980 [Lactococcus insecticola]